MKNFIFIDNAHINVNDIIVIENDVDFVNIYCTNNILHLDNKNLRSDVLIDYGFFPLRHDFYINTKFVSSITITDYSDDYKQAKIKYISDYSAPKLVITNSLSM